MSIGASTSTNRREGVKTNQMTVVRITQVCIYRKTVNKNKRTRGSIKPTQSSWDNTIGCGYVWLLHWHV